MFDDRFPPPLGFSFNRSNRCKLRYRSSPPSVLAFNTFGLVESRVLWLSYRWIYSVAGAALHDPCVALSLYPAGRKGRRKVEKIRLKTLSMPFLLSFHIDSSCEIYTARNRRIEWSTKSTWCILVSFFVSSWSSRILPITPCKSGYVHRESPCTHRIHRALGKINAKALSAGGSLVFAGRQAERERIGTIEAKYRCLGSASRLLPVWRSAWTRECSR